MIFIYNCYGGTHSSSLAAAVHLGKLSSDRIPSRDEVLNVNYFNRLTYKDMGRIIFRGKDNDGNKVFTVGRGTSRVLIPCMKNLINLLCDECGLDEKLILSNMSPTVPFLMTMGGFFSRGLGVDSIGVPLLVAGARQSFKKVVAIVNNTKESALKMDGHVLVLANNL